MRWSLVLLLACGDTTPETSDTVVSDSESMESEAELPSWQVRQLSERALGPGLRAVRSESSTFVAAYDAVPTTNGTCDSVEIGNPPRLEQGLWLLDLAGSETQVSAPVVPGTATGAGLAVHGGQAHLAWAGGEPEARYCGGHDLITASGPGFSETAVVSESNEAFANLPASDAGFVVGWEPALGVNGAGERYIAYRDVHFGSLQTDDLFRADLEIAYESGGWQVEPIDPGRGAGEHIELAFDGSDPVVAYTIPVDTQSNSPRGVWLAQKDTTWSLEHVLAGPFDGVALAVEDGRIAVASYDTLQRNLALRIWDGSWSEIAVGSALFDEGRDPSLHFEDGELIVAYHRCRRLAQDGACDPNEEGLVLARESSGYAPELVAQGEVGQCGLQPQLLSSEEIVFRCDVLTDGLASSRVFLAEWGLP